MTHLLRPLSDFGFRISDLGFLSTIGDVELTIQISPLAVSVLTSFSANFQSAMRNGTPGGTPVFVVSRRQFMKYPG